MEVKRVRMGLARAKEAREKAAEDDQVDRPP